MKKSLGWNIVGVLSVIAGVLALFNPFIASFTAERMAGWFFLVIGIALFFSVFSEPQWGGKIWALLWAAVGIWCGITLLWNPLNGMFSLTLVLGVSFLIAGIFKAILAFKVRAFSAWWGVLFSAALSMVFGFLILNNLYTAALGTLGILLGLELIQSGVSLLCMGHVDESKVA